MFFDYLCRMNPRKLQIIQQVKGLYQRYGIKSVTMDDVAGHLGISKKTLYEHFRDKQDLVEQVLVVEHERTCDFKSAILSRSLNAIEEMFELYKLFNNVLKEHNPSMVYDIRKYYPALYTRVREIRRQSLLESVLANLEKGKREGLYRHELNVEIIAKLHVFRVESPINICVRQPSSIFYVSCLLISDARR
jgi:AcrR family transcriptional regulator